MPRTPCRTCNSPVQWWWEHAFDKFGFGDGDGLVMTHTVALVLQHAGYSVEYERWGLHNEVITSIRRHNVEQIPPQATLGYDDPRRYLPPKILEILDRELSLDTEVTL